MNEEEVSTMNLIAERNFLRRALMHAEANLGCAATMAQTAGLKGEAEQFYADAAYCRAVRCIVSQELPKS